MTAPQHSEWRIGSFSVKHRDTAKNYTLPKQGFPIPVRVTNAGMPPAKPGEITHLMRNPPGREADRRHPSKGGC